MKINKNEKNEFVSNMPSVVSNDTDFILIDSRNHDFDLYNDAIEVCVGLWNFNLKYLCFTSQQVYLIIFCNFPQKTMGRVLNINLTTE